MSGARALEWPGCKAIGTTLPEVGFGGPAIGNRQPARFINGGIVTAALNLARGRVTVLCEMVSFVREQQTALD